MIPGDGPTATTDTPATNQADCGADGLRFELDRAAMLPIPLLPPVMVPTGRFYMGMPEYRLVNLYSPGCNE